MNSVDPGMKYQVFEMSHSLGNEIKVSKSNLKDFNFAIKSTFKQGLQC